MDVAVNGKRLREIRQQKAIERRELEQMSGVHVATIVRIELGQRTARLNTAKKLAAALGINHSEFADGEVISRVKSRSPA